MAAPQVVVVVDVQNAQHIAVGDDQTILDDGLITGGVRGLGTASNQRQHHDQSEEQRDNSFHNFFSFLRFPAIPVIYMIRLSHFMSIFGEVFLQIPQNGRLLL
jgi:hypothetical protein